MVAVCASKTEYKIFQRKRKRQKKTKIIFRFYSLIENSPKIPQTKIQDAKYKLKTK